MTPKIRTLLALVAVIVPLDQITKSLVSSGIERGSYWAPFASLEGFFRITHARNPGAALGLAQGMPVWGPIFRGLDPSAARTTMRIDNLVTYLESLQGK